MQSAMSAATEVAARAKRCAAGPCALISALIAVALRTRSVCRITSMAMSPKWM
jgi:hypothetical protein